MAYLKNAYNYYKNQSYKNKEFVVVCRSDDLASVEFMKTTERNDSSVKTLVIGRDQEITLGELRNLSIDESKGEYICIWDDDDTYHPNRLTQCLSEIQKLGVPAVALSNVIMHDVGNERSYISPYRVWEATLFCEKHFLKQHGIAYPSLNRGEDTPLLDALGDNVALIFHPHLYIYKIHSFNTCPTEHFAKLIHRAIPLMPHESGWIHTLSSNPREDATDLKILHEVDFSLAHKKPYKQLVSELAIEV
ncbi:glycosyltransferase family 2 protein [Thalassomonas viridans]|uniref:Glycosyltransferase family 2 protein n=1 Tax=Thalassomonas viridans TaxID=137584 RepID=A0AAE9Z5N6_9GAMM|nr:glycosyltransferase family 2 protein [Thalassomonas viridans]